MALTDTEKKSRAGISRLQKLWQKGQAHQVKSLAHGRYQVVSGSSGLTYDVALQGHSVRRCNCDYGLWRHPLPVACSHVLAAARHRLGELGYRRVEVFSDRPVDSRPADGVFSVDHLILLAWWAEE